MSIPELFMENPICKTYGGMRQALDDCESLLFRIEQMGMQMFLAAQVE
jgi:hypothetical protein